MNNIINLLDNEISKLTLSIEMSRNNRLKHKDLLKKQKTKKSNIEILDYMIPIYKQYIKDIQEYQAEHKANSINDLYRALHALKDIIPDSDEIAPIISKGSFSLRNAKGVLISEAEGGGAQTSLSVLIRHLILSRTDFLKFMILDENLAQVSEVNSSTFSKYIPFISKDTQLILIEQKSSIFDNVGEILVYEVYKENTISKVKELRKND